MSGKAPSENLLLVTGNPAERPASFSRFLFPFAYSPEPTSRSDESGFEFKKIDPAGHTNFQHRDPTRVFREAYFTPETASALFERAGWFELLGKDWRLDFEFNAGTEEASRWINVRLDNPMLVLFEWAAHDQAERQRHNILASGFLVLEAFFPEDSPTPLCLNDLLWFNEWFRYFDWPFQGHERHYGLRMQRCPIDFLIPERKIGDLTGDRSRKSIIEAYFHRWGNLLRVPFCDNGYWRICSLKVHEQTQLWLVGRSSGQQQAGDPGFLVYSDNRALVWTCAILPEGGGSLRREFWGSYQQPLESKAFGHWIKLLNVDSPPKENSALQTHQDVTEFERRWAEERTYRRWEEYGTWYGFNYHSGALLAPPLKPPAPPVWLHFRRMYFDQFLLLFYLRVSLFRFSSELSSLSARARDCGDEYPSGKWRRSFQQLRWEFAVFTNLYQFPLISNQQQGIEIYSLMRKAMDVDELFEEVEKEVSHSHAFLMADAAHRQGVTTTRLTVVATFGLVLAIVTGFFGMNLFVEGIWIRFNQAVGIWLSPVWSKVIFGLLASLLMVVVTLLVLWKSDLLWNWMDVLARFGRRQSSPRDEDS